MTRDFLKEATRNAEAAEIVRSVEQLGRLLVSGKVLLDRLRDSQTMIQESIAAGEGVYEAADLTILQTRTGEQVTKLLTAMLAAEDLTGQTIEITIGGVALEKPVVEEEE